jgi:hypothetical protein
MLTDERGDRIRCNPLPPWLFSGAGRFVLINPQPVMLVDCQLPVAPEQPDNQIAIAGTIKKNAFFIVLAFFLGGLWPRDWLCLCAFVHLLPRVPSLFVHAVTASIQEIIHGIHGHAIEA